MSSLLSYLFMVLFIIASYGLDVGYCHHNADGSIIYFKTDTCLHDPFTNESIYVTSKGGYITKCRQFQNVANGIFQNVAITQYHKMSLHCKSQNVASRPLEN